MAQFTFKCPQCGMDIEANDSIRGQVAECPSCGKGIVIPRATPAVQASRPKPLLRPVRNVEQPIPQPMPDAGANPTAQRRITQYEQMAEREAARMRRETTLKIVHNLVVLVIVIVIALTGWSVWTRMKMAKEKERATLLAEEQERRRKEEEAVVQRQKRENEERDKAITTFHAYLDREEARLKDVIEEAKIAQEACDIDRKELVEELERIEKENARIAEANRQRKQKRYDKAERVMLLLKSPTISAMYEKYLGEDIAALRAKYEGEVKTIIKLHRDTSARLRQNRDKYFSSVKGINEEIDTKNEAALRRANIASDKTRAQLQRLREKKIQLEKRLSDEQNKKVIATNTSISGKIRETNGAKNRRQRINELTAEIARLDREIATAEALASGNQAQMAHLEATTAETSARRKFDTAIEVRQSEDNDVHAEARHESDVFHVAARYEKDTLEALRRAIHFSQRFQESKEEDAKRKLDFITRSASNIDFMKPNEIEDVRKRIVAKLAEGLADDDNKKPNAE